MCCVSSSVCFIHTELNVHKEHSGSWRMGQKSFVQKFLIIFSMSLIKNPWIVLKSFFLLISSFAAWWSEKILHLMSVSNSLSVLYYVPCAVGKIEFRYLHFGNNPNCLIS